MTRAVVSALADLSDVRVVGILVDTGGTRVRPRLQRLRRRLRSEGWSYLWFRLGRVILAGLERLAARVTPPREVAALLETAFPEQAFSLARLGARLGIPVLTVHDLNGRRAVQQLRNLQADLGVVVGTRILKRSTFAVPRLGSVNLHLGKVPEYRGMPPAFWELYDGQRTAGVTVHLVDDGLDTGDVLGEATVEIHERDTVETLARKLEAQGREVLTRCVVALARGRAAPRPQSPSDQPARTVPTRRERLALERRLLGNHELRAAWVHAAKTALYLLLYHAGAVLLVRAARRITGTSRACIVLYHRVNDLADDVLTTSVTRFAEHMLVLRRHCTVLPTATLVECVQRGRRLPPHATAIHFDDCYRDVATAAAPVLAALGWPACVFVSSGFVGTERRFEHDARSPWVFENLRAEDLRGLVARGIEIGSHTVNHADLGQCAQATAADEVVASKRALEAILGRPVVLFSYPFGKSVNIRDEILDLVRQSGYEAVFSADGGHVTGRSSVLGLPRVGASTHTRPLDLLMEIEGLSLGIWRLRWQRWRGTWARHPQRAAEVR